MDFDQINTRLNTNSYKWDGQGFYQMNPKALPMWVADMDFKTDPKIIEVLNQKVSSGIFGYTFESKSYYQSIVDWMQRRHHWNINADWIVCTPGVVSALHIAILAFTSENDAVLIQRPVYYPFTKAIELTHRKVVNSPLIYDPLNLSYQLDLVDFESKIINNQVKMFILCNPHNPIGKVYTIDELRGMLNLCMKHHVLVVSDEIHMDFVYQPAKHHALSSFDPSYGDYSIICTSTSKTFNLAGLKTSNIIIQNPKLKKRFMETMDYVGMHASTFFGTAATEAAYTYGDAYVDQLLIYLKANLNYCDEFLRTQLPMLKRVKSDGLYLIWVDCRSLHLDHLALEHFMVNKAELWFDQGYIFGDEGQGFVRINLACPRSILEEALTRLKKAVDELK